MALADQVGHLAHDLLCCLPALQRHDVPAQEDVGLEIALERLEHRVAAAREFLRRVVVELDLRPHAPCSFSLTLSDTRRPSARPATSRMATGMTLPMSRGVSSPVSATAAATMRSSSRSSISTGR